MDPNPISNKLLEKTLTQEEIIEQIIGSDTNFVQVSYSNKYLVKYLIKNDGKILLSPTEPYSCHLIRLIGLNKLKEYQLELDLEIEQIYLPDILFEISNIFEQIGSDKKIKILPTDYCTITGQMLRTKGLDKINFIDNQQNQIKAKHLVLDNRITDLYQKDPVVCEFLIQTLIAGTTHPKGDKIFSPMPVLSGITNLSGLKTLLEEEINRDNLSLSKIAESRTDIELMRMIDSTSYGIINNAISDNFFSMGTIQHFATDVLLKGGIPKLNNEENKSVFEFDGIKFIGFNYSYEIESTFKKEHYLFHGTPMYSWYPIIKKGLKVMSGTEFQANGAAYGNGIYFSDSFQFSLGYSQNRSIVSQSYGNPNPNTKSVSDAKKEKTVVGVFEINDDIEKYKKTTNIYVINNDKIMLLRYLIVVEKGFGNYQDISDYFFKYLGGINKFNQKKSIDIKNKRLIAEKKLLDSNSNVCEVEIIDETKNWVVSLKEIKNKSIKLNVYFNDYPKLPPKIILESDINKKIICDSTGSINLTELSPSNWEVTNNLSKLIDKINNCISNSI
jgi:ubiquitin-protein ligase